MIEHFFQTDLVMLMYPGREIILTRDILEEGQVTRSRDTVGTFVRCSRPTNEYGISPREMPCYLVKFDDDAEGEVWCFPEEVNSLEKGKRDEYFRGIPSVSSR